MDHRGASDDGCVAAEACCARDEVEDANAHGKDEARIGGPFCVCAWPRRRRRLKPCWPHWLCPTAHALKRRCRSVGPSWASVWGVFRPEHRGWDPLAAAAGQMGLKDRRDRALRTQSRRCCFRSRLQRGKPIWDRIACRRQEDRGDGVGKDGQHEEAVEVVGPRNACAAVEEEGVVVDPSDDEVEGEEDPNDGEEVDHKSDVGAVRAFDCQLGSTTEAKFETCIQEGEEEEDASPSGDQEGEEGHDEGEVVEVGSGDPEERSSQSDCARLLDWLSSSSHDAGEEEEGRGLVVEEVVVVDRDHDCDHDVVVEAVVGHRGEKEDEDDDVEGVAEEA